MISLILLNTFGIFDSLANYGALGLVTLASGGALWYLLKRQIMSEERLQKKVDELQKEMTDYILKDQREMKDIIEKNTDALTELSKIIYEKTSSSH